MYIMSDIIFNKEDFERAVDLAVINIKRKYIQKILDLYQKIKPENDYFNVIYTIRFFDGSKEMIKTITKDVWEFYDPNEDAPCNSHKCSLCNGSSSTSYSSVSSDSDKFN